MSKISKKIGRNETFIVTVYLKIWGIDFIPLTFSVIFFLFKYHRNLGIILNISFQFLGTAVRPSKMNDLESACRCVLSTLDRDVGPTVLTFSELGWKQKSCDSDPTVLASIESSAYGVRVSDKPGTKGQCLEVRFRGISFHCNLELSPDPMRHRRPPNVVLVPIVGPHENRCFLISSTFSANLQILPLWIPSHSN